MRLKELWREPLLHFLLIGALLFVVYSARNDLDSEAPKRIVVTPGQIEQLAAGFQRTWSRPPTADELDALIENQIRDEVFYREALAMGLDQNDPIVRRRMRQKLEFMLEDLSSATLDEAFLQAYFEENSGTYLQEPRLSFEHIYLNPDRHKDLGAEVDQIMVRLENGADPRLLGDPTLIAPAYELARQSEIARDFGAEFAQGIVATDDDDWHGLLYSAFGAHLVRITQRVEAQVPDFESVRELVRRDYLVKRQNEQKNLAYEKLREGYAITIEAQADPAQ